MMRKLFAITFCLTSALFAVAQNSMSVVDFRRIDNDLTATLKGTAREDQNGDKAALLKIVTLERGFTFGGDMLGIVATEDKPNAIWVYVPHRSRKITIQHPRFGVLTYDYPISIEKARTYEMLLDFGLGRYVTVNAELPGSHVFIDGEDCGESPVVNRYVNYGQHTIRATKAPYYEGSATFDVLRGNEQEVVTIDLPMEDMASHYGDVTVDVDNEADIYFGGTKVGNGRWQTKLREGKYIVETRKVDCDSVQTTFNVVAGQENTVTATPPVPHTGWLSIYTHTKDLTGELIMQRRKFDVIGPLQLPVGRYPVEFSKKDHFSQKRDYDIRRDQTTSDTITLVRSSRFFQKEFSLGFGCLGKFPDCPGLELNYIWVKRHIEFGIALRGLLTQTSEGEWVSPSGSVWEEDNDGDFDFAVGALALFGYRFRLTRSLAITPHVGCGGVYMNSNIHGKEGGALLGAVGLKTALGLSKHSQLYVTGRYEFKLKQEDYEGFESFDRIGGNGFTLGVGFLFHFEL